MPVVPGLSNLSVFARGGYATVYRATQGSLGRPVAVKIEHRTLDSQRDQRRFMREAQAAAKLSAHPHVVDLIDAGVTADRHPYLIMELCEGSYADRMRTSPLNALEARDVGVKIADALADAHSLGVLHRDVKPANILYSRLNSASLADFGLAVLVEARDPTITVDALTPAYAAPEMFQHAPPSPALDVYALCATLYAVMRGRPPRWRDDGPPSLVMLLELFNEPIPDLPGIPPELTEVLRWGMANDPKDRPTARELRDLLAALPLASPRRIVAVPRRYPGTSVPKPATAASAAHRETSADGSAASSAGANEDAVGARDAEETPPFNPIVATYASAAAARDAEAHAAVGLSDNTPTVRTTSLRRRFPWMSWMTRSR